MRRPAPFLLALAAAFAAGLAVLPGPLAAQSGASVSGTVLGIFQGRLRPLPYATVEVWGPGLSRSTQADSLGRYRLSDLPAGALRVRASHPGHDPVTVDVIVPAGEPVLVDLELEAHPVQLPEVNVTTDVRVPDPDAARIDPAREGRVEAVALETGSGLVDAGLADAVRALGGNDPAQPTDVLFMRGSTTDLKLVLLDGAPVYTPFHVAGLLRSFDPDVLGTADLLVGGAPARYDGGLTYILDLQTRRPRRDRVHSSGSLDLLAGTLAADGPLGDGAGFLLSARTLHDLGRAPLGTSPYGYADVLAGVEVEPARNHEVRATGFWNRESVRLDLPGTLDLPSDQVPEAAWWANRAASVTYQAHTSSAVIDALVAGGGYEATLPLQPTAPAGEPVPDPLLATAHNDRVRGSLQIARPTERGVARVGVSFESLRTSYDAFVLARGGPVDRAEQARAQASAHTVGAYVDVSRSLGESVVLRAGLRGDVFDDGKGLRLAPRAALTWMVAPQAFVTVAAGRYHQNARVADVQVGDALASTVSPSETPSELLPVATADHVVVSLDQTVGEKVRLGLAGYWKAYEGLRPGQDGRVLSSGVDLRVQRPGERATVWLGYGLSWYWSAQDLAGSTSGFSGRQLLSAGVTGAFSELLGGDLRVAYGSGLPYTSIPFHTPGTTALASDVPTLQNGGAEQTPPFAGGLDEDFLRVDVELHAVLHPEWLGRRWEVRPYLRVLNALDRRDALFYAFQPWRTPGLTPLAERPLVPVLGFEWRF
ncbi:MAG: TonB-dependent receptor [Gemmatimonadetes bacterium]|nr:TonB-dependent receptor [Gemmatimonadota bacterium]